MIKNITVLSSEGEMIGVTYPKRALGLVKKGRARFLGENTIMMDPARSPIEISQVENINLNVSQEDAMNINFNFDEFIEKAKATAEVAGEGIMSAATKAEEAFKRAMEDLNTAINEHVERNREAQNAEISENTDADIDGLEEDIFSDDIEAEELEEATIEEILGDIEDKELQAKLRAKIRSQIEREKAHREREKQYREVIGEYTKKATDLSKSAANAVMEAAKWSGQAVKEAAAVIKEKVSERAPAPAEEIPADAPAAENSDLKKHRDLISQLIRNIAECKDLNDPRFEFYTKVLKQSRADLTLDHVSEILDVMKDLNIDTEAGAAIAHFFAKLVSE